MCGGGSKPSIPKTPEIAPRPTISPSEESPSGIADDRKKRVRQYRSGFASTIKTGATGLRNDDQQGKTKLGA